MVKNNKLILHGKRNKNDGLWDIPIGDNPVHRKAESAVIQHHSMNVIIRRDKIKMDLAQFLYDSTFSPVKSTLIHATKNNHFTSWPRFTAKLLRKQVPNSMDSAKGHMNQERQGLQTIKKGATLDIPVDEDMFSLSDKPNLKTHQVMYTVMDTHNSNKAYIYLTGRFPHRFS